MGEMMAAAARMRPIVVTIPRLVSAKATLRTSRGTTAKMACDLGPTYDWPAPETRAFLRQEGAESRQPFEVALQLWARTSTASRFPSLTRLATLRGSDYER